MWQLELLDGCINHLSSEKMGPAYIRVYLFSVVAEDKVLILSCSNFSQSSLKDNWPSDLSQMLFS